MTDSDADLFWRSALVAEQHPDAPDCVVECAGLLDAEDDRDRKRDLRFVCPECAARYYGRHAADACCGTPEPGVEA